MLNKEIVKVFSLIELNWKDKSKNFFLGIDGLSRSGKTSFSKQLHTTFAEKNIVSTLIHLDDFITPKSSRYNTSKLAWEEYYYLQWDIEFLKENLFQKAKTSCFFNLLKYNYELDKQDPIQIEVYTPSIIIIEGVFLQRPEWKQYLDYTIFVESPREIRFSRESNQSQLNIEKFERRYWPAEDYYLDIINPRLSSNFIIEN